MNQEQYISNREAFLRCPKCSFRTLSILMDRKKRHFGACSRTKHAMCFNTWFLTDREMLLQEHRGNFVVYVDEEFVRSSPNLIGLLEVFTVQDIPLEIYINEAVEKAFENSI